MNCPNCRHENANDARFCAQCATPLTQPAPVASTTPTPAAFAAQPAPRRHTGVLLALLLLLAVGGYAAFHQTATKAGTPAPAAAQNAPGATDSHAGGAPQRAQAAGPALGGAVGAGGAAKGTPDTGNAPDNPAPAGQPIEQHDNSSGTASGAPAAPDSGQAANAMAGLLGALSSAVGGTNRHDPVDFHTLEALLPSSLPNMQPGTPDGNADETMSIKTTSAHVDFAGPNDGRIHMSVRDATAISGLAGLANMANSEESQQGDSYEKTETIDGRSVHERWDAAARHGELSLSVGQRFAVDVVGDNVEMDALKGALAHIDLARLESMKDANPIAK